MTVKRVQGILQRKSLGECPLPPRPLQSRRASNVRGGGVGGRYSVKLRGVVRGSTGGCSESRRGALRGPPKLEEASIS